ncbi:MAG: aminopeptidase P family protein, partial [Phycisphaerae bacterium]|nr:aminopeptidase P family protein [Phycisphaerae bacterium]
LAEVKPGMTEQEVAARLEYHMRCGGADGPSFPIIVGAGANGSIPHYMPGRARVKKHGTILIDFGARYRGYCSDMTRVVALGRMPRKLAEIYKIVLNAQLAGIDAIGPGVPLKKVDAAARAVIDGAGYAKHFRHGLGHGIGLEIHEEPRLSARSRGELQPGQVVTVEPGIYLPGVGGVRLEDDILVTDRGHRNLCRLPKSLESAII